MVEPVVAVDARHLKSGIGSYLESLIPRMIEQTSWRWRLIGPDRWQSLTSDRVEWRSCDLPIYTFKEHQVVAQLSGDADLLWVPQYNAPWMWDRKLVVTLHDLIHRMPQYTPPSFKTWVSGRLMARSLKKAQRVITVSEYSKSRLQDYFPRVVDKCTVIHNGVRPVPEADRPHDLEGPYVLAFGNALPHKNLSRLIEAFVTLPPDRPEILVVAGPEGRDSGRLSELASQSKGRVKLLGPQDAQRWAQLLRHATLYCCPSLEEGFGLPPLEALSVNVPVVCARSASLPEVLSDAAIWCEGRQVSSIADALLRGLTDIAERRRVVAAGQKRVSKFTWEASAQAHMQTLATVLGE